MKASYREAIEWLAYNDDTSWVGDPDPVPSVAASTVGHLWDKSETQLALIARALNRIAKKEQGTWNPPRP